MKVLFFCNLLPRKTGSFEVFLSELAVRFRQSGDVLVFVFAGDPIPDVAASLKRAGAGWDVIEGWSDGFNEHPWRFCLPALRLIRKHKPDVAAVHFGNELPSMVVSLLAPIVGSRGLRWVWQQDQQISAPSRLTARVSRLRLLALRFKGFVAVYEGGKESLLARGIPGDKVVVIHNSVADYSSPREAGWLRQELGVPSGAVILGTVGSLVPRKRHDFLLRAMQSLPACIHMVIVGDGPLKSHLRQQCVAMGLADRVYFLGLRNDVRDILADVDVYVHASIAETCTYATTESMCSGKPAVVTVAGAAREQILDGISGYVVGPEDSDGFVRRISELAGDAPKRAAMGKEARRRWDSCFKVESQAVAYHELYRSIAGQ